MKRIFNILIIAVSFLFSQNICATSNDSIPTYNAVVKTKHASIIELNGYYYMPAPYFNITPEGYLAYNSAKLVCVGDSYENTLHTIFHMYMIVKLPTHTRNLTVTTSDSIKLVCFKECKHNRIIMLKQDSVGRFTNEILIYGKDLKSLIKKLEYIKD